LDNDGSTSRSNIDAIRACRRVKLNVGVTYAEAGDPPLRRLDRTWKKRMTCEEADLDGNGQVDGKVVKITRDSTE
jgi:hypothetical protein